MQSTRNMIAASLGLAAASGCFSPNDPPAGSGGSATETTSSGSASATDSPTTGPSDESSGTNPATTTSSQDESSSGPGSTGNSGVDSTGSSTTGSACDALDDTCGEGLLCDGSDCVAPPEGMVAVPGGTFMMGCNDAIDTECLDDQYPYHELLISSFAIDQTEVTASAYAECVDAGECPPPEAGCNTTSGEQPVVCVNWFGARDYCTWREARLPTEAEWEKAARGTDGRLFPWGNDAPTCAHANLDAGACGASGPIAVGSKPAGASPYGALDMAGNVFEWVSDWYDAAYYVTSPGQDPQGPADGMFRAMRSTASNYILAAARTSFRGPDFDTPSPDGGSESVGFRCALSP